MKKILSSAKVIYSAMMFAVFLCAAPAAAGSLRIVAPYAGSVVSEYSSARYGLDLRGAGVMQGLYAQWIDPEKFQGNAFYYRSPDVNYSRLAGLHLNFDWYPVRGRNGKYVLGAGLEDLNVDMNAVKKISGVDSLSMKSDVLFYFLRAGRYFYLRSGGFDASLLPYAGCAWEKVTGEMNLDLPGPFPPPIRADIGGSDRYPIAGLNLGAVFRRFLEVQVKWMGRVKDGGTLNEYSGMVNLNFTRHIGLSYRYKYMEYGTSSAGYDLVGAVYAF